jgi:hypothetical protein
MGSMKVNRLSTEVSRTADIGKGILIQMCRKLLEMRRFKEEAWS